MSASKTTVTLIGCGLAGPQLAISLVKRGYRVQVFERRPDMRRVKISAGRSINLAVSTRGIHALSSEGLWQQLQNIIVPMRGRMMHSVAGELTFQRYGKDDTEVINSISRADLNVALLNAAEQHGVNIHFEQRCTGCNLQTGELYLRNEVSGERTTAQSDIIIGSDGSASAVRMEMLKAGRFNFTQNYLDYGYKELTIPADTAGRHALEPNALHIWPRGNFMLIALPNIDGTFACILFLPFEGENSFAELTTPAAVQSFFSEKFADALRLMPQLTDNYFANPVGSMVTVKCSPWHHDGRVLLLGDAAHAIVPFFGQGLNCALEDCTVFVELLDRIGPNWAQVFEEFQQSRRENTDAIADMAVENFVEMRDKVADPRFLFKKKAELALEAKFPQRFVPRYAMVTFHRVPYTVAASRGRIQDRILSELCDGVDDLNAIDYDKAAALIGSELPPLREAL